jgi:hypothetical protein
LSFEFIYIDGLRKLSGSILDTIGQFSSVRKQDIYVFLQERKKRDHNLA